MSVAPLPWPKDLASTVLLCSDWWLRTPSKWNLVARSMSCHTAGKRGLCGSQETLPRVILSFHQKFQRLNSGLGSKELTSVPSCLPLILIFLTASFNIYTGSTSNHTIMYITCYLIYKYILLMCMNVLHRYMHVCTSCACLVPYRVQKRY